MGRDNWTTRDNSFHGAPPQPGGARETDGLGKTGASFFRLPGE